MRNRIIRGISTIPEYPKFKQIESIDGYILQKFTKSFLPYSDFTLTSLLGWGNDKHHSLISTYNGNVVVKFLDNLGKETICSTLGRYKLEETIEGLLESERMLKYIPEFVIFNIPITARKKYNVIPDRDNFDYIYTNWQTVNLDSAVMHERKIEVDKFLAQKKDLFVRLINLSDLTLRGQVTDFYRKWLRAKTRKEANKSLELEFNHFDSFIRNLELFNYFCVTVYINQELVGFSITEIVNPNYAMTTFSKSRHDIRGLSKYLMFISARECTRRAISYINLEPDLGIPGLRRSKMSWKPIRFLKKYTITRKE